MSEELQLHLRRFPGDWKKFQDVFNKTLDRISLDILLFEKANLTINETKVYKLKKIFERRYRSFFLYGIYPNWSYENPYG